MVVHGVAMETAADLIVHAPTSHRVQGLGGHLQRPRGAGGMVIAQQEFQDHRLRELCGTPSAVHLIKAPVEILERGIQRLTSHVCMFHAPDRRHLPFDGVYQLLATGQEFCRRFRQASATLNKTCTNEGIP